MKFRCVEVIKIVKLITNRNFPEYRKIFPTGNCELSNCHPVTKIAPQSSKIPKKLANVTARCAASGKESKRPCTEHSIQFLKEFPQTRCRQVLRGLKQDKWACRQGPALIFFLLLLFITLSAVYFFFVCRIASSSSCLLRDRVQAFVLCFRFLPHPMTTMTEEFKNGPSQTISRRTYLERERLRFRLLLGLSFHTLVALVSGSFFSGVFIDPGPKMTLLWFPRRRRRDETNTEQDNRNYGHKPA